jgi:hypothetical protein
MEKHPGCKLACPVGKGFQAIHIRTNVQVAFLLVVGVVNVGQGKTVKKEIFVKTTNANLYSLSMG